MSHLKQEDLLEHYYAKDPGAAEHLEHCQECSMALKELEADFAELKLVSAPSRDEDYGQQVWDQLKDRLVAYPAKTERRTRWGGRFLWPGLGYAAACAAVIAGAFFAGRVWEQHQQPPVAVTARPPVPPVKQRVVVVVLGDHLDRSERLLVQLKHVDASGDDLVTPLRKEARSLLEANQICLKDAAKSGDPDLEKALDHLNRILNQLATQPGGMNAASIAQLQNEMNENGLLFEVRVLRSRIPKAHSHLQGGTI